MERKILKNPLFISCPLCEATEFRNLVPHIMHYHKQTVDEFRQQTGYQGPVLAPGHARMMAIKSNLLWGNEEVRARRITGLKESYTEKRRMKKRENCEQQWQDPEIRAKRIASIIAVKAAEDKEVISRIHRDARQHLLSPMTLLRQQLYERAGSKCEHCGVSEAEQFEKIGRRLHLHHKNYNRIIPLLEEVELLCHSCHIKYHNSQPTARLPTVAKKIGELLQSLGVDLKDENFVETPRRFATYLLEHFADGASFSEQVEGFEDAVFPSEYGGLVLQEIQATGMCPHHLLPIQYYGVVAYIPVEVTIGLSKLSRVAQECLRYPILQEFGTLLVADTLSEVVQSPHVAVILRGKHMCMTIRGIKAHGSSTTTSELRGDFYNDKSTRAEFMSLSRDRLGAQV